jgi:hypothetical protein
MQPRRYFLAKISKRAKGDILFREILVPTHPAHCGRVRSVSTHSGDEIKTSARRQKRLKNGHARDNLKSSNDREIIIECLGHAPL